MTNNFSYCVSAYLNRNHNYQVNEELVFLLGSSLSLHLARKDRELDEDLDLRNEYDLLYLNPINTMSLEYFAASSNCILDIYQTNDNCEILWLLSNENKGNSGFLVKVDSGILGNEYYTGRGVYALVTMPEQKLGSDLLKEDPNDILLDLSFTDQSYMRVTAATFMEHWVVTDNELFNAHRYALLAPALSEKNNYLSSQLKNAMERQYHFSQYENVGTSLLHSLKTSITSSTSVDSQKGLFNYLQGTTKWLDQSDMARIYFAGCILMLPDYGLPSADDLAEAYLDSGEAWQQVNSTLSKSASVTGQELQGMYEFLIDKESRAINELKKYVSLWN